MIEDHISVFQQAADKFVCQIVVREVNPLAARWFKHPRQYACFPKPVTCSAKTANAEHPLGGLVVNPEIQPTAFKPKDLWPAKEKWLKFLRSPGARKYRVIEDGQFKGALLLKDFSGQQSRYRPSGGEALLHSDYDLLAVHKMKKAKKGYRLDQQHLKLPHGPGPDMDKKNIEAHGDRELLKIVNLEFSVQQFVNSQLNLPVIQHGSESTYGDFGAGDDEEILIFPPGLVSHRRGKSFCSDNYLNAIDSEGNSFTIWKVRTEEEVLSYRSPHSR